MKHTQAISILGHSLNLSIRNLKCPLSITFYFNFTLKRRIIREKKREEGKKRKKKLIGGGEIANAEERQMGNL